MARIGLRERSAGTGGLLASALLAALLTAAPSGAMAARVQATGFARADVAASGGAIEIVVDASGSMRARMGEGDRMDVARAFVEELRAALAEIDPPRPLALRAYGSGSHRLRRDCTDTRLLAGLAEGEAAFDAAIEGLQPLGVSPQAWALERAAADTAGAYVLVTDGGDNCGGDPCATWRAAIAREGDNRALRLHVVAIEPEPADLESLRCLSRAGSGSLLRIDAADEAPAVARRLALILQNRGLLDVRLAVGEGEPFVVPVRLMRPLTGEIVAAFPGRRPRPIPAGVYTLIIETAPPITIERTMVLPGETLRIERTDFGRLVVELATEAGSRAPVTVRSPEDRAELRYVRTGDVVVLAVGRYDVEVELGDSLAVREGVPVAEGETTRLSIGGEEPGTLHVVAPGFELPPPVRVLAYGRGGVDTLAVGRAGGLSPGRYRLVVQTLPPYVTENVDVDAGRETVVTLPETGVLGVDLAGAAGPLRGVRAEVLEPSTGESYGTIRTGERRLAMPGTYAIRIATAPPIELRAVTVRPGEERVIERTGLARIVAAPSPRPGAPLRLEVLTADGNRSLAEAAGLEPWVAARPGTYRARVWRGEERVWEGTVSVAPDQPARIDWAGPQ